MKTRLTMITTCIIGFVIGDAVHSFNEHPRLSTVLIAALLVQLILMLVKPETDSDPEPEV
jgi:hypothetical protein